jgi:glycosyltransferase involved in cell wall biosynthesis
MRILLANKFYYARGGDCIYTMSLEKLLKSHGHDVAIFSMQYPDNVASEWSKYWPSEMTKAKVLTRPFGDGETRKKFAEMLDAFHPNVVHLNNIHTQLSPIIAKIAHEKGIKVVWTLHDSKLACPCYTCQRDGKWCEECFDNKFSVIKHRCMPGGVLGSLIGWREIRKWNPQRLEKCVDSFISPSSFMMDTVARSGYKTDKFRVLCNFIDVSKVQNPSFTKSKHYIFVGRLSEVKGIKTLCKAASNLPYKLIVVGGGELLDELRQQYANCKNIEFLGQQQWGQFRPILESARFMVLPSEWSENNPLTIIESQSLGTPILGARIGGIPELINENVNGMTFESGNVEDLKDKITQMWNTTWDYKTIASAAQRNYSAEMHYEKLMAIYQ